MNSGCSLLHPQNVTNISGEVVRGSRRSWGKAAPGEEGHGTAFLALGTWKGSFLGLHQQGDESHPPPNKELLSLP